MNDVYVVIIGRAEGNERTGFRTSHYWDGHTFDRKPLAVSHGFELAQSDDFNIGIVRGGQLVSIWWMDKQIDEDAATLAEISEECGFARLARG